MHQRDMETLNIGAKLSSRLEELEVSENNSLMKGKRLLP